MAHNPDRTPILAGVAQVEQRVDDPREAKEPLELMYDAIQLAAEDAGSSSLLAAAQSMRVNRGVWAYEDPGRVLAERIGVPTAETAITSFGGNYVQTVANRSFVDILSGERDIIVMTGAECGRTQGRAASAGIELQWSEAPGEPDLFLGSRKPTRHEAEIVRGIEQPVQYYPFFEIALRHAHGEPVERHLERISELWARFNEVAQENPHAWIRRPLRAEEIRTPSSSNRPISFPYPKLMNANMRVDQGAALILCSVEAARRHGVPEDRWIYPWAGTDAWDHIYVSIRENLHSSPAIRFAGRRALQLAGVETSDLDHIDVYSCFPSAVQVAAQELELPLDRRLTVTGGLTFAGGPLNNYVMHSIARMAELLRDDRGSVGLITANGGLLTKHAFCIYSARPPEAPFRWESLQAEVDRTPRRDVVVDWNGEVTVESYVVMYGHDGARVAHVACLLDDGRRTWANADDPDLLALMTREEICGRRGRVDGQGRITVQS